jgi:hypothetical protein
MKYFFGANFQTFPSSFVPSFPRASSPPPPPPPPYGCCCCCCPRSINKICELRHGHIKRFFSRRRPGEVGIKRAARVGSVRACQSWQISTHGQLTAGKRGAFETQRAPTMAIVEARPIGRPLLFFAAPSDSHYAVSLPLTHSEMSCVSKWYF